MKPIALLMNDLHISKDNVLEFQDNWDEALRICDNYQIENLFIGGDIFTTRNIQYLAPMKMVQRCLEKSSSQGIKTVVAFGNHDCPVYGEKENWCDLYKDIKNVEIVNDFKVFYFGEKTLAIMAYFPEESILPKKLTELDAYLAKAGIDCSDVVLYLHAGVHGALGDFDVPNEIAQEPLLKYYRVLCAHYHNRAIIQGTNIEYIGSSRAHTFGEDEDKGYTILYSDGSTKFIRNEVNSRYVTEDLGIGALGNWESHYDGRYKIRLKIHCTAAEVEAIDRDDLFNRGVNKIEFVTEKLQAVEESQSEIEDKFDSKNLQIEYKAFCKGKDIDSRFGIDYLSKIK